VTGRSSDRICRGLTGDTYPMALPATVAMAAGIIERDDGMFELWNGDGPFPTRRCAEECPRRAA
jgi:hypothetical protein